MIALDKHTRDMPGIVPARLGASTIKHDKAMVAGKASAARAAGAKAKLDRLRANKAELKLAGGAMPHTAQLLRSEKAKKALTLRAAKNAARPEAAATKKAPPFQSSAAHKAAAEQDRRQLEDKTSALFQKAGVTPSAVRKKVLGLDGPMRQAPAAPEKTGRENPAVMGMAAKGKSTFGGEPVKAAMSAAKFAALQKSLGAAPPKKVNASPAEKLAGLRAAKAAGGGGRATGLMAKTVKAKRAAAGGKKRGRAKEETMPDLASEEQATPGTAPGARGGAQPKKDHFAHLREVGKAIGASQGKADKAPTKGEALLARLRYHVSGAIARGEGVAIVGQPAVSPTPKSAPKPKPKRTFSRGAVL